MELYIYSPLHFQDIVLNYAERQAKLLSQQSTDNTNLLLQRQLNSAKPEGNFPCASLIIHQLTNCHNQSIHWHVQNAVIPCHSQEPLPFLPVIHFFLPLLSADHSSILPHFIQPSISWSTSWSCCFHFHIQYSFGKPIFFHSLYMSKPT